MKVGLENPIIIYVVKRFRLLMSQGNMGKKPMVSRNLWYSCMILYFKAIIFKFMYINKYISIISIISILMYINIY